MNRTRKNSNKAGATKAAKLRKTVKNSLEKKLGLVRQDNTNNNTNTTLVNQRKVLDLVCPNSNMCLAFNKYYSNLLKDYFDHFLSFKYLHSAKRITEESVNGVATIVKYNRDGYESSVIVKTIRSTYSYSNSIDNLYYEAFVGMKTVNDLCKVYPVFVETYGVGSSNRQLFHDDVNVKQLKPSAFKTLYRPKDIDNSFRSYARDMITYRENHVLFAQTIDTNMNLFKFVQVIASHINKLVDLQKADNGDDDDAAMNTLAMKTLEKCYNLDAIMYQVYHALACENERFAHNDLHLANVLVYKIPRSHHITYNYFDSKDQKDVSISSKYVPKIIDYGMSFTDKSFKFIAKVSMIDEAKLCVFFRGLNSEFHPYMFGTSDDFVNYLSKHYGIQVECFSELDDMDPHDCFIKLKTKDDLEIILDLIQKFKEVYPTKFDDHGSIMLHNEEEVYIKTMKNIRHVYENHKAQRKNMCDAFLDYNGLRWASDDHNAKNNYVSSILYNGSSDLKCFHGVVKALYKTYKEVESVSTNIRSGHLLAVKAWIDNLFGHAPVFEKMFGTPYIEKGQFPKAIVNVQDAMKFFRRNLEDVSLTPDGRTPIEILNDQTTSSSVNYATMDVFSNGKPMKVDVGSMRRNVNNNANNANNNNINKNSNNSNSSNVNRKPSKSGRGSKNSLNSFGELLDNENKDKPTGNYLSVLKDVIGDYGDFGDSNDDGKPIGNILNDLSYDSNYSE